MKACEEIRENLRPILEKLENPSWEQLVKDAHQAKVNLTASYTYGIFVKINVKYLFLKINLTVIKLLIKIHCKL